MPNDLLIDQPSTQDGSARMGRGRTGPFLGSEAGTTPDIVRLSKSIGGYGFPLGPTLPCPDLDVWGPDEHNRHARKEHAGRG